MAAREWTGKQTHEALISSDLWSAGVRETDPKFLFSSQAFWSQFAGCSTALLSSCHVYFSIPRKSDPHSFSRPFLIVRTMSYKCCTIGNRLSLQLAFYAKWVWDKQNHYVSASTSHHVYYSSDIPLIFQTALSILFSLPVTPDRSLSHPSSRPPLRHTHGKLTGMTSELMTSLWSIHFSIQHTSEIHVSFQTIFFSPAQTPWS